MKIIPLSANLTVTRLPGCCNAFARCECAEYGDAGQDKIAEFQRNMPQGYDIAYPKDSTEFIKISVEDVIQTLFEAIVLVVLRDVFIPANLRATLIPALAVPSFCWAHSAFLRCLAIRLIP